MCPTSVYAQCMEEEYLVLGRLLMDRGFKELFMHDPQRACTRLGVSLPEAAIVRIQRTLTKMDSLDTKARGAFTTRLNSLERSMQK